MQGEYTLALVAHFDARCTDDLHRPLTCLDAQMINKHTVKDHQVPRLCLIRCTGYTDNTIIRDRMLAITSHSVRREAVRESDIVLVDVELETTGSMRINRDTDIENTVSVLLDSLSLLGPGNHLVYTLSQLRYVSLKLDDETTEIGTKMLTNMFTGKVHNLFLRVTVQKESSLAVLFALILEKGMLFRPAQLHVDIAESLIESESLKKLPVLLAFYTRSIAPKPFRSRPRVALRRFFCVKKNINTCAHVYHVQPDGRRYLIILRDRYNLYFTVQSHQPRNGVAHKSEQTCYTKTCLCVWCTSTKYCMVNTFAHPVVGFNRCFRPYRLGCLIIQ